MHPSKLTDMRLTANQLDPTRALPKESLGRLLRTAKQLFNVPMILFSLIDNEQLNIKSANRFDADETLHQ